MEEIVAITGALIALLIFVAPNFYSRHKKSPLKSVRYGTVLQGQQLAVVSPFLGLFPAFNLVPFN